MGPGAYFTYANLNFGLLATIIENVSGQRFDLFMEDKVLAPLAMDAGFNWSGVSRDARKKGAVLYRQIDGVWAASVDEAAMRKGNNPFFLTAEKLNRKAYLKSYKPGHNGTLFSPQGGLRASVSDLTRLAQQAANDPYLKERVWRFDPQTSNGDTENGFFQSFGHSVQHVAGNDALLPGETLIGHPGEAYGLYSGAWVLPASDEKGRSEDITFSFAITGTGETPRKGAHPSFNKAEEQLVRLAMRAAVLDEEAHRARSEEPRPFDKTRTAMADVDATLASAATSGKRPLLVLGANWCHDSRGLASKFETPVLERLIQDKYELLYVDVGHRDRNLDVARRFGFSEITGTPTVIILSSDGEVLNADTARDWRRAHSISLKETEAYFTRFASEEN